jgi:hypothetical protein
MQDCCMPVCPACPCSQDTVVPEKREGALWDMYRSLQADGWSLDASGYTTSFRCGGGVGKLRVSACLSCYGRCSTSCVCSFWYMLWYACLYDMKGRPGCLC